MEQFSSISFICPWVLGLAMVWSLVWKGFALWRAAANRQKIWFVALLLIQSLGILEIIYLFFVDDCDESGDSSGQGERIEVQVARRASTFSLDENERPTVRKRRSA